MTKEQQVAIDAMREAWPADVMERGLAATRPLNIPKDKVGDLTTHPDDRFSEAQSIDASHEVIDAFFHEHRAEFARLVLTYADSTAQEQFEALREKFWGEYCPLSPGGKPPGASTPRLRCEPCDGTGWTRGLTLVACSYCYGTGTPPAEASVNGPTPGTESPPKG